MAKYFISSLPSPTAPATIVNISTSGAWLVYPMVDGYSVSKLAALQWSAMLASAYKGTLTVVNIHPGMVDTDMQQEIFRSFNLDSPLLAGGVAVWAAAKPDRASFLSGRVISANWDVEELLARKSEIEAGNKLTMQLEGTFGTEQFKSKQL